MPLWLLKDNVLYVIISKYFVVRVKLHEMENVVYNLEL